MSQDKLKHFANCANIAVELSEEKLADIGQRVILGFTEDMSSNKEWLDDVKRVEELATLKSTKKSTPLPNSANIKLPIITKACYEFTSRTYPEIVKDGKVVQFKTIGKDYDGAKALQGERCADYMNYQLLYENSEWELELDRLLMRVALVGFVCKKVFYDPIRKKVKSILCNPEELIINSDVTCLKDAARISHIIHFRLNDLVEHKNKLEDGVPIFLPSVVEEVELLNEHDQLNKTVDLIEQHTFLDLDEDGYAEPYIVTVLRSNGKVLRIAPRFSKDDIYKENGKVCYITPENIFVDYHFLPNPKGKFQSVGFGILLLHLNEAINSTYNQLMDSAQLANMKGGYMDARLKELGDGNSRHDQGEFKQVKVMAGLMLKDGILPIDYKEPSSVMFQLLGLLIDTARDLSSSSQINNGTQSSENAKTGATMALQEEGRKTFNSINKRVYRSIGAEFKYIFHLNGIYLNPLEYKEVVDDVLAVRQKDFDESKVSIIPVADPNLASTQQRMNEAQFVQQLVAMGLPGIDPVKATKFILQKTMIPGISTIMVDPDAQQPPNPAMIELQAKIENMAQEKSLKGAELDLKHSQFELDSHLIEAQIEHLKAQSIALLAQAEAADAKIGLETYKSQLDGLNKNIDASLQMATMKHEKDMQAAEQSHQQMTQEADLNAQQTPPQGS